MCLNLPINLTGLLERAVVENNVVAAVCGPPEPIAVELWSIPSSSFAPPVTPSSTVPPLLIA